jgi:HSP20 family protein
MENPASTETPAACGGRREGKGGFKPVFDNYFSSQRPLFSLSQRVWNPPADVYETQDSIVMKMEIAGVCQETLEVTAENNFLVIRGSRGEEAALSKENYHLMEIRYGRFERVFGLPFQLSADDISANYNNGFLVVSVSKKAAKSREVAIRIVEDITEASTEKRKKA